MKSFSHVHSLQPHGLQPNRLLCPWGFPGENTGVGCHFLLQEIFPTQGSNPGLPHCRQTLYCLSHQGSPEKGSAKECSNCHTIALISHASKVMLKILQARLQQYVNHELQMFKLDLEKPEDPEIKLSTSVGSSEKQESFRKTSTSALLTTPKPLTGWITTNYGKVLKEMRIPSHLTCLLRNLYEGQEAAVRTGRGTTDWLEIGKGVHQGCILSPCLFNLYAEYIM